MDITVPRVFAIDLYNEELLGRIFVEDAFELETCLSSSTALHFIIIYNTV